MLVRSTYIQGLTFRHVSTDPAIDDVIVFYIIRAYEWCVKMQERIAPVDDYQFDIEVALSKQLGAKPLPFVGMDSKLFYIKTTKRHI